MAHRQRLDYSSTPGELLKSPLTGGYMANSFMNGGGTPATTAFGLPAVTLNADVDIRLDNDALWSRFDECATEMIVTKTGRRMFPTLRYALSGLEANASYAVFLELCPVDECRYKFQQGRWVVAGRADPTPSGAAACMGGGPGANPRLYAHPDSPAPGRIWMRQPVSFHRIKLTNNAADPHGHVLLNSMHKYQPRVFVLRLNDFYPAVPQLVASAAFPQTRFVAVTAYQNERVIQLKIDHNPFAKGFRDGVAAPPQPHKRRDDDVRLPSSGDDDHGAEPQSKRRSMTDESTASSEPSSTPSRPSAFAAVRLLDEPKQLSLPSIVAPSSPSSTPDRATTTGSSGDSKDSSHSSSQDLSSSESLSSPVKPQPSRSGPVLTTAQHTPPVTQPFGGGAAGIYPFNMTPSPFHSPMTPASVFAASQQQQHANSQASNAAAAYWGQLAAVAGAGGATMNPFLASFTNPFSAYTAATTLPFHQQYLQQQQQSLWMNPLSALLAQQHQQNAAAALFRAQQ